MRPTIAPFPIARSRRLRRNGQIRDLVREHSLTANDLIWPIFMREGDDVREPVTSMPGVERLSIDNAVKAAEEAADLGMQLGS